MPKTTIGTRVGTASRSRARTAAKSQRLKIAATNLTLPRMPAGRPYGAGPVFFCGFLGAQRGAAPAARQRRRSGRRPLKTARRAVWAAPYGLRFAVAGIGKYWRSGAVGMGIETIRANFFEIGCQKNGGSFVKSSEFGRNINTGKDGFYGDSTEFDRKLAG